MSAGLLLPQSLWAARDAAIAGVLSGYPDQAAENALKDWILSDVAYDLITASGDTGIGTLCDLRYSDVEMHDELGLKAGETLGPNEVAKFARLMLEQSRADSCGPYLEAHTIVDTAGHHAVIGLTALAAGQGGMEFSWQGVFSDQFAFIDNVLDSGCAVDSWLPDSKNFDNYTDEELVALMGR
jgi:hypothetical protein